MYHLQASTRSCAMEKSMICPSKLPQYTVVEFSFAGVLWAMGSGMAMTTLCFVFGFSKRFCAFDMARFNAPSPVLLAK